MTSVELSAKDFNQFRNLVYEKCGINLGEGKKDLVRARLSKRLRKLGLESFRDYYKMVTEDSSGQELVCLMDAISTNLTSFFREKKHFDFLTDKILPDFMKKGKGRSSSEFRVWSAGCSSGEEPYSISISLNDFAEKAGALPYRILATDISTKVLDKAASGIYDFERVKNLNPILRNKCFLKGHTSMDGQVKVKPFIREPVTFKRLNLMDSFPFRDHFDLIFCRNVMIYFDKKTQEQLVKKYHDSLRPGGYLFIGHSESLMGISHSFSYVQPTIYLKSNS
ncbi:CheR family methyltransferase [Desulforegula conservatrix]|uniref:CheR family methyltransferase n=1 Tax=Desulforegula conservatrix TaxID=153026 RepID=UPI000426FAEF|nr:protein-glutamate O-methyltransferase CheR [Desulforegula conservatrix]